MLLHNVVQYVLSLYHVLSIRSWLHHRPPYVSVPNSTKLIARPHLEASAFSNFPLIVKAYFVPQPRRPVYLIWFPSFQVDK